jgi:hypothetical protein
MNVSKDAHIGKKPLITQDFPALGRRGGIRARGAIDIVSWAG